MPIQKKNWNNMLLKYAKKYMASSKTTIMPDFLFLSYTFPVHYLSHRHCFILGCACE